MANYCFNRLTIRGDSHEVNRFRSKVWKNEEQPLDFNRTVPQPKELEGTESPNRAKPIIKSILKAKYGADNWYDWQQDNWGCKWGPYDGIDIPEETVYKNGKGKLVYEYNTPWSPPNQWLINTSKQFPSLKFENYCNEPGNCFKGTVVIINGQVTKDTIK